MQVILISIVFILCLSMAAGISIMASPRARMVMTPSIRSNRARRAEVVEKTESKEKKCNYTRSLFPSARNECAVPPPSNYLVKTYHEDLWQFHQENCVPKELNIQDALFDMLYMTVVIVGAIALFQRFSAF